MENTSNSNHGAARGGVGFLGLLTILFIGLKLTGYINWEWWWVLAPLWIPLALFILGGIIYVIVYVIASLAVKR